MIDYSENSGKQYHIGVGKEDIGKYVILPGDPGRCAKIAKYFDIPISYFETVDAEEEEPEQQEDKQEKNQPKVMIGVCVECGKTVYDGEEGTLSPKLLCNPCYKEKLRAQKATEESKKREEEQRQERERTLALQRKADIRRGRNRGLPSPVYWL